MYSHFLHQCRTEPTRLIEKQNPSLIDTTFVKFFNKKIISGNLFDKISDHTLKLCDHKRHKQQTDKEKISNRGYE